MDPSDPCYNLNAVAVQANCTGYISAIHNGFCITENNNAECLFDGGDCCECTLSDDGLLIYKETLSSSLYCVDPSDPCYNLNAVAVHADCTGTISAIQDGQCSEQNNNEECLYDGGDCCFCTCTGGSYYECGTNGYNCLDPNVTGLEAFICSEPQPTRINCSAELRREWIVENATQARALADAVRCVGEVFNVTWKGKIIVDETISIVNGTVLNIVGIDSDAVIDGNGNIRMFTVVNASLHLRDITLELGYALYGGAVAASRSRMTLDRVIFMANNASYGGGAIFLSDESNVSFFGETTFWKNTAFDGGALYMTEGCSSSWQGNTSFSENVARSGNGGALYMKRESIAFWTAASQFLSNYANVYGGALYIDDSSKATWTASSQFISNSAHVSGGALYVTDGSNTIWTADSQFLSNSAHVSGGALYVTDGSNTIWTADSQFLSNSANVSGGALYVTDGSSSNWTATSQFCSNNANLSGGALYVTHSSSTVWWGESQFQIKNDNNILSEGSTYESGGCSTSWEAKTTFFKNAAAGDGGALYLQSYSSALWTEASCFDSNSAYSAGGALFVTGSSSASWAEAVTFSENAAAGDGGALYLEGALSSGVWT